MPARRKHAMFIMKGGLLLGSNDDANQGRIDWHRLVRDIVLMPASNSNGSRGKRDEEVGCTPELASSSAIYIKSWPDSSALTHVIS